MFGKRIKLFAILGFNVWIDFSWIIIAVFVTWTLALGVFPYYYGKFSMTTYWLMGIVGTLGLFTSIIIHELCHSLVSRNVGLPIKGITLFIFGGVSEMSDEPPNPRAEFLMAIVGPLSSIFLGILLYGVFILGEKIQWPEPVNAVINYLSIINGMLAGFNLMPAYPLDGGRVLRSALWVWKKNIRWATNVASQIGSGFAVILIIMGIFVFIGGNFIGGMWWFLIGWFLRNASESSYRQVLIRQALAGEPVSRFMMTNPITVPANTSIEDLVNAYIYRYHYKLFPVVDSAGKLIGCVTTRQVKSVPHGEWAKKTVAEIADQCSKDNTVKPQTDATQALMLMNRGGISRLLVTEAGHLVGIITLKDMLKFFSLKMELDPDDSGSPPQSHL
jgi:Zn-dependent protease/predicted transcriptional regulator